jgi:hypothetical protein
MERPGKADPTHCNWLDRYWRRATIPQTRHNMTPTPRPKIVNPCSPCRAERASAHRLT